MTINLGGQRVSMQVQSSGVGPAMRVVREGLEALEAQEATSIAAVAAQGDTSVAAVEAAGSGLVGDINDGLAAIEAQETASVAAVASQQTTSVNAVSSQQTTSVAAVVTQETSSIAAVNAAGVTIIADATAQADIATAAAASVSGVTDKLEAIETLGRPIASPPVTGSAVAADTYVFATAVVESGVIESVRAWGLAAGGTLKLRKFDRVGDTFTQSGSDVNVVLTAGAGLKTVSTVLAVTAGQYVGYYAAANLIARNSATVDSGGFYTPPSPADSTSFDDTTPVTTLRHEIGIDITYQSVTAAREETQDSDIATLQEESEDYENRIAVTEEALVTQIIGKQSDPITGATTTAGTYVLVDPAIGDGRISQIKLFGLNTSTIYIKVFSTADGVHTQVGSDVSFPVVAGLNTFETSIPIEKGKRVGWYMADTRLARVVATAFSGGSDFLGATNLTTGTAATVPSVGSQFQLSYTLEVARPDHWPVTIRNSDRILLLGDSFTEGPYTQRGKNWPAKVSEFNDWMFDNFSVSGNTATEILSRIRNNVQTLGVFPYRDRSGTYALIYVGQNDSSALVPLADFLVDMAQLIETVKGLGATPILVAPHSLDAAIYGQGFSLIYRNLAEEHGCLFVDVAEWARVNDYGARYGGFWNGTHPGVRTNQLQVAPVERLLNQIEAPRQSIKLFRKRSGVSVTTVADLMFNTPYERVKLFKEILIGTGAIKVANENLYDEANTLDGAEIELLSCEYEALQNGDSIAMEDYSLIEVTLPTTAKHIDQLALTLNETGATVYCRGILTGTIVDGSPLGTWIALNGGSGVYRLSNSELKRFMRQDKVSFLVVKSGGIAALTEPLVEWVGTPVLKPAKVSKTQGRRALGAELLANPDLGVSTSWTATGTISHGAPADGCLPYGSTGRATVDNSNYVQQAVTYAADNERSREIEVRVNARMFPAIFASGGTYPGGAGITQDSFDWGMLQIEIGTGAGRVPYHEKVGLWWGDIVLRTIAPLGTTGLTLYVRGASGSPAIEVSKASFRFVDA